jgi:uncharacterized protein YigE (DUF2233 family)
VSAVIVSLRLMAALLVFPGIAQAVECKVQRFETLEFATCRVDLRHESLRLYWRDKTGKPYRNLSNLRDSLAMDGKAMVFATNAGMYQEDLSPLGLFVADHRELTPLNRRTGFGNFYQPPNGVFLVDEQGARIITTAEYADLKPRPSLATQSGPILVYRGVITGSPVMSPKSTSQRIRNGVCAPTVDAAVFAISDSPVTFYVFAKFFLERIRCREALYLDGSISSLHAPSIGREDRGRDLGPMLAVTQ